MDVEVSSIKGSAGEKMNLSTRHITPDIFPKSAGGSSCTVNLTGEGLVLSDMSQAASALSELPELTLVAGVQVLLPYVGEEVTGEHAVQPLEEGVDDHREF